MLEIGVYVLNSVSTKSIPNTRVKLLTSSKVSIQHYRIWRCPAYVFKGKTGKLDTKIKLCYFIGYRKGTKRWLLNDSREQIVLASTNAIFLEDNYIMDQKPNDRFDLRELSNIFKEPLKGVV